MNAIMGSYRADSGDSEVKPLLRSSVFPTCSTPLEGNTGQSSREEHCNVKSAGICVLESIMLYCAIIVLPTAGCNTRRQCPHI